MEDRQVGSYVISDDPARLDANAIDAYLTRSYWSAGIPQAERHMERVDRDVYRQHLPPSGVKG